MTAAAASVLAPARGGGLRFGAGIGVLFALTLAALAVSGGSPAVAVAPVALVGVLVAIWRAPLRATLLVLLFFSLTLENPAEQPASGLWQSPLYIVGALLLANLNTTLPIKALRFSGLDLMVGYLLVVIVYRKARSAAADRSRLSVDSSIDQRGMVQTAGPLGIFAGVSLFTLLAIWAWGLARGGDFTNSLWQTHQLLFLPILFFLFQAGLRGPKDQAALGRVILASACIKAMVAVYVRLVVHPATLAVLPYATAHADSMLFASAFGLLVSEYIERPDRRRAQLCAALLPILLVGMAANRRRIVWVEVGATLLMMYLMSPPTPLKRRVQKVLLLLAPLIPLYLGIGWNSGSSIFKPVQIVKTIADSKADRSTETRDVENYNLISTLKDHPIAGTGFGHEYVELVKGDDISKYFAQYRFIPHNSVLGLWAFTGVLGFTGLWSILAVGVFFAARAYRATGVPARRAAALWVVSFVLVYVIQAYGDMGIISWTGVFLLAPALAQAGKLAVATGAWPERRRARDAALAPEEALPLRQTATATFSVAPALRMVRRERPPA